MKHQLHPIRTEADYEAALKSVEVFFDAPQEPDPNSAEGAYFEALVTLIEGYERKLYSIEPPTPIEAIKFRMEQQGLSRRDLESLIGTRTRVAEILNRRRNLSIGMIRRLHKALGISAEVLIRPSRKDRAA